MSVAKKSLDELRRKIDDIDTAIHDLLMQRTELVDNIGQAKGEGAIYIRPGREALVLRRLIGRHRGPFPKPVVVRIWREIFSVFTALQGPLTVAVYAPAEGPDLRAVARDHFGSLSPITGFESKLGVLRAVTERQATVGVLPLPQGDEKDPWWRYMAREGDGGPRIVARLPFASVESGRADAGDGLAVALAPQEETGSDRSYLVVETAEQLSRSALKSLLAKVGLQVRDIQVCSDGHDRRLHLIEVEGWVTNDDPRIARLHASGEPALGHSWAIGGYAVPLTPQELASGDSLERV